MSATNPTERPEERGSLAEKMDANERYRALEAEVKELRERVNPYASDFIVALEQKLSESEATRKQMEEALREARKWCPECGGREYVTDPGPPTQQTRQFCPVCRFIRAALSPSDGGRG